MLVLLLMAALLSVKPVTAAEFHLKDGTEIVGKILAFEQDAFRVETSLGFAIIHKDRIARILFPEAAANEAALGETPANKPEPAPKKIETARPKETAAQKPEAAPAKKETAALVKETRRVKPSAPPTLAPVRKIAKPTKKAPKVWTNDDIAYLRQHSMVNVVGPRPAPAAQKAEKEEQAAPQAESADLWTELDQAREKREVLENNMVFLRQQMERWTEQSPHTTHPALKPSIERAQHRMASQQDQIKELDASIAALEKQTEGRKRPAPEAAPQAGRQSSPPPPSR